MPKILTQQDVENMIELQDLIETEEIRQLEKIANQTQKQRPKLALPHYQVFIKKIIAWVLTFNAKMEVAKFENGLIPIITLRHSDYDALHRFSQIVKVGSVGNPRRQGTPPFTITKAWTLTNIYDMAFLLKHIIPYIRTRKAKHKAQLLKSFCDSRAKHLEEDYTPQERDIAEQIKKLNSTPSKNTVTTKDIHVEVW